MTVFERSTRYHIVYAVPAILIMFVALATGLATAILLVLRRIVLNRMRWFLYQTSLGRSLTAPTCASVSSQ